MASELTKPFEEKMKKTLTALDSDYGTIRAGRANPHVLDKIKVDYYGTPTPLQQVGNVTVPEPRMIQIAPWEKSLLKEIEKADGLLFGSPTILQDALKPIWDLTTAIHAPTHGGKLASAFGSYAWSGEAVNNLTERLKQLKMKVVDGYRVKLRPSACLLYTSDAAAD